MNEKHETSEITINDPNSSGDQLIEAFDIEVPAEAQAVPSQQPAPPPSFTTPVPPGLVPTPADWTRPQGREFFKCKKGHVTEGYGAVYHTESDENPTPIATTGPLCWVCQLEFHRARFSAKPYTPPQLGSK